MFKNQVLLGTLKSSFKLTLLIAFLLASGFSAHAQEKKSDSKQDKKPKIEGLAPIGSAKTDKTDGGSKVEGPSDGIWYIDAKKAFAAAKSDNKKVLMNFTGSDWCSWCIKLESEVFSKSDFTRTAKKNYVFLKLDFPSDASKLSPETKEQNEELKTKFGVAGFPSIYICDDQGRPFAKTGYQAGGPEKYLAHLNKFSEKLTERNELFALASKATGEKKAELLDRALSLMDENIVSGHYEHIIKEIVALDKDNKIGLRKKYYAAQDAEERRRVLAKIDVIVNSLSPQDALVAVDDAMKETFLPTDAKIDALQQKLFVLRKLEKNEDADKLLDEMVVIDGISPDRREKILIQKTFNYIETDRAEEGLAFLDDNIKTYPKNYTLLTAKGEILDTMEKHDKAIEAFDAAIQICDTSEGLSELVSLKAYSLAALEKMDEALKLFEEFVDSELHPDFIKADLLVQKAILLREADRADAAELAEKQALELADTDEQRAELQELIDQLKDLN